MQVLIILGHPDQNSFNHAIAHALRRRLLDLGHEVIFHDLSDEAFDPILPAQEVPEDGAVEETIRLHCEQLRSADGIVIVHPNWWGQPPAILKGWIDRVFRPGIAYRFEDGDSGEGVPVGLLNARAALVFNTSNTSPAREQEAFGDPLEALWKRCIFDLCGVSEFHRKTFSIVITSSAEQRRIWIEDACQLASNVFPAE